MQLAYPPTLIPMVGQLVHVEPSLNRSLERCLSLLAPRHGSYLNLPSGFALPDTQTASCHAFEPIPEIMHLILTGATGLVGSGVLDAMLKSKEITKISILSRRPVPLAANDPRANVIIHKDFENYEPELLNKLQGANGVVWALGISQLKVTKEFVYLICLELNRISQADDL